MEYLISVNLKNPSSDFWDKVKEFLKKFTTVKIIAGKNNNMRPGSS